MRVFSTVDKLQNHLLECRKKNSKIGFVPTMGSLHEGHLTLVKRSIEENDVTVCSIYVNPTQFNDSKDFEKYPKDLDRDARMLESVGCDVVFTPSNSEMYPTPTMVNLSFGQLETVLEGAHRPDHFNGVGIIVSKLFNIVQPNNAYFGQKDCQQFLIISRLVKDLSFPLTLHRVDTVREPDGLAMSSRNQRLTSQEREIAPALYQAISLASKKLKDGTSPDKATAEAKELLAERPEITLEYLEIVNTHDLTPLQGFDQKEGAGIFIAAHLGKVRLIDNLIIS